MSDFKPPYKFNFRMLLKDAQRKLTTHVGSVSISLPFLSISLNPNDLEKHVAREIVIRMADRRVLNSFECCDNCIDRALLSLQEVRRILVDKQVELSGIPDSPLYLLIELQVEAIRQFLTFEERLKQTEESESVVIDRPSDLRRPVTVRAQYFAALEMLRAHLYRCLLQISKIADTEIPKLAVNMRYNAAWQLEAYEQPKTPENNRA
ncbi:MAG: hypothetical protein ACOWWM_20910 [Desulfobacterales bacterium]